MKKKTKIVSNFGTAKNIKRLIEKWRTIIGVDPIYIIQFIETTDDLGYPAWVDGINANNPHPMVNIVINSVWLDKNKHDQRKIESVIIHELLHIIIFDAFMIVDPNYKYKGNKARANEILTMKMSNAIMKVYYEASVK